MATSIQSTKLDFDEIKSSLKTYFAQKSEFADYDFEASGLSNVLDVLAYNTHYNALTANFALNEAFLNTAQLRSSVISHAATLGYEPRSITTSSTSVNLSLNLAGVAGRPSVITLPAFSSFSSKVGENTFTFQTLIDYLATDDGTGLYNFTTSDGSTGITLSEGSKLTKTFYVGEVGERQLYVIPDSSMDTSTAIVKVYETTSTSAFTTYTKLSEAVSVTGTSTLFQITEAPNGFYELNFGDGISFGKAPPTGGKITVEYLATAGIDANGAFLFTPAEQVQVNGVGYTLSVTTLASSNGGAPAQSIESIRTNAPIAFAAQQRLVTADDYKAIILKRFSAVTDCAAWGGEDNIPANYGNTYVSLVFAAGYTDAQKTIVKDNIRNNLTNNLSIISIDTIFSDPVTTYLTLSVTFNFNPALTGTTIKATENSVIVAVKSYFENNLKKFGGVFRRSNLLATIDNISPAILNSQAIVKLQQRFVPTLNVSTSYNIVFPVQLQAADDVNTIIETSTFIFNNRICSIKNKLNSTTLQVINASAGVEVDNVGEYLPEKGTLSLTGFNPTSITAGVDYLKISALPANTSTIVPLRNYVLDLDEEPTYASGIVDRQTQTTSLGSGAQAVSSSSSSSSSY